MTKILDEGCVGGHRAAISTPTCYEVVDDGVGALIRVHRTGDIPHHGAWPRVLGDRECLVLGTIPLPETPEKGMSTEVALNKSRQIPWCSPPW